MIGVCVCVCANQKIFLSKDEMAAKFCTQNRSLCVCKCVCVYAGSTKKGLGA